MKADAACMSCSLAAGGRYIPGPLATMYVGRCPICLRDNQALAIPRGEHDMPEISEDFIAERRQQKQQTMDL